MKRPTSLIHEFRRATSAVIRSTLLTALVQACAAFAGFLIARAPQPIFLALVTFMFALVPLAGAAFVTVTTGVMFTLTGYPAGGNILCVWGVLAVGLVFNVVKAHFIMGGMKVRAVPIAFVIIRAWSSFGSQDSSQGHSRCRSPLLSSGSCDALRSRRSGTTARKTAR